MDYQYENAAAARGFTAICGIDEAGRGPLAGPVYAAAVILPPGLEIPGLNDSKKLSEKKRETLFDVIKAQAVAYGIASVDEATIDEINILQATFLAMQKAVAALQPPADYAIVDGNRWPLLPVQGETLIRGDALSPSVAAASILAKVSRDRYMRTLDAAYPQYQFARHKGYGTKLHYEMLEAHGPAPCHRRSFLKKLLK